MPAKTEWSDNHEIKCHEKKYHIEIVDNKQSLVEDIIEKICKNCNKTGNIMKNLITNQIRHYHVAQIIKERI